MPQVAVPAPDASSSSEEAAQPEEESPAVSSEAPAETSSSAPTSEEEQVPQVAVPAPGASSSEQVSSSEESPAVSSEAPAETSSSAPEEPAVQPAGGSTSSAEVANPDEEVDPDSLISPSACLFDGKVYVSAQQIPREDHCDFCFCFRGDIICLQQSCPPPIPGCIEEGISGFCCPRYECPVRPSTQNVTLKQAQLDPFFAGSVTGQKLVAAANAASDDDRSEGREGQIEIKGCDINNEFYATGTVVPAASGPCLECRCGSEGLMECDPRQCQPEPTLRKVMALVATRRRRHIAPDGTIWMTPRRS